MYVGLMQCRWITLSDIQIPAINKSIPNENMMTSSNGNIFRVTSPLWGESTGNRWIPLTNASDAGLWCLLWSTPEQTVEQTVETTVIWDDIPRYINQTTLLINLCDFTGKLNTVSWRCPVWTPFSSISWGTGTMYGVAMAVLCSYCVMVIVAVTQLRFLRTVTSMFVKTMAWCVVILSLTILLTILHLVYPEQIHAMYVIRIVNVLRICMQRISKPCIKLYFDNTSKPDYMRETQLKVVNQSCFPNNLTLNVFHTCFQAVTDW